ncbi:K Homology domain, type 1, partial [Dillenia turbinata]
MDRPAELATPSTTTSTTFSSSGRKRRHQQSASSDTVFRILCPAAKTGGLIGKGGAIIRQIREETAAKIRIDDAIPGCDERAIVIVARGSNSDAEPDNIGNSNGEVGVGDGGGSPSPAQLALVRVFERILKLDEGRAGISSESDDKEEGSNSDVVCRLLAPSVQVGSVLGRGGKVVEKIRQESGAQVRVLPKDHIPACAALGDELIQITGNLFAVRKALLSVSSCLQDSPRADAANFAAAKPSGAMLHGPGMPTQGDPFSQRGFASGHHAIDYHPRGYSSVPGPENAGSHHGMVLEEDVVFRLLCQIDKVGSLIGKGGSMVRALQNETGASIKVAEATPEERVVVISAREACPRLILGWEFHTNLLVSFLGMPNSEQNHSPAQDAVIRVHSRIAEVGFEPGAAVVARLLVQSQQIGCLLGKGGNVITEMRRATGARIRIIAKEQVPKCGSQNDEVVQVIGSSQCVQDALFHITSRLRETIFPMKPPLPNVNGPPYIHPFPEMPPPMFRPRHDPSSPSHYPSPVGHPRGIDCITGQPVDNQPPFPHGIECFGPSNSNRGPYPYRSERSAHGPYYDNPSSPRMWSSQAVSSMNLRGGAEAGSGLAARSGPPGSGSQPAGASSNVEVVVPQTYLTHIYGENNSNLSQIRQISGAKVVINDPKPGDTEGVLRKHDNQALRWPETAVQIGVRLFEHFLLGRTEDAQSTAQAK